MPKYECDCGRVFGYPDGPIMCADSGHGQKPVTVKKLKPILHVCENGEKEDVADKVALGFKFCCWCGKRYGGEND